MTFQSVANERIRTGDIVTAHFSDDGRWHFRPSVSYLDIGYGIAARDIERGEHILFDPLSNTDDIVRNAIYIGAAE